MPIFTAHYLSLKTSNNRANGLFDFESCNRLGTKALMRDARLAMLERFGNESLPWTIDRITKKKKRSSQADGQLMIDFRPEINKKRKKNKGWW